MLLLICVVAGVVYAVVRGLALWRVTKQSGGAISREVEHVSAAAGEIEVHLQRAAASQEQLAASAGQLSASRARLEVQLAAVREARVTIRRLLWFLPG